MPRKQTVKVSDKTFEITEKRICELEKIFDTIPFDAVIKADSISDIKGTVISMVYESLGKTIGIDLTEEDVRNAYPSELEALVEAFIDVNFFGLKRVAKPIMGLALAGFQKKS